MIYACPLSTSVSFSQQFLGKLSSWREARTAGHAEPSAAGARRCFECPAHFACVERQFPDTLLKNGHAFSHLTGDSFRLRLRGGAVDNKRYYIVLGLDPSCDDQVYFLFN